MSARRAERKASPRFEIARVLVCFSVNTGAFCGHLRHSAAYF
jgi:hypothetical protein